MDLFGSPGSASFQRQKLRGCRAALVLALAAAATAATPDISSSAALAQPASTTSPAGPPVAGAPSTPAGPAPEPRERVLNVTLVPATAAPRADRGQQPPSPTAAEQPNRRPGQRPVAPLARRRDATRKGSADGAAALWLGLGAVAALLAVGGLSWRRRAPRCATCGAATRRLTADAAFAELDMAERTEQLVGDVRHTVWRCTACGGIEKRGVARDVRGLIANATAPPVGSAAFLRRRTQSGMSIWTPPDGGGSASSSRHRKPLAAIPKAPGPSLRADDRPPAPSGDGATPADSP